MSEWKRQAGRETTPVDSSRSRTGFHVAGGADVWALRVQQASRISAGKNGLMVIAFSSILPGAPGPNVPRATLQHRKTSAQLMFF